MTARPLDTRLKLPAPLLCVDSIVSAGAPPRYFRSVSGRNTGGALIRPSGRPTIDVRRWCMHYGVQLRKKGSAGHWTWWPESPHPPHQSGQSLARQPFLLMAMINPQVSSKDTLRLRVAPVTVHAQGILHRCPRPERVVGFLFLPRVLLHRPSSRPRDEGPPGVQADQAWSRSCLQRHSHRS